MILLLLLLMISWRLGGPPQKQTHPHLNVVKRRHHPRSKLEWNFDKAAATSTHTDFYTRANVKMPTLLVFVVVQVAQKKFQDLIYSEVLNSCTCAIIYFVTRMVQKWPKSCNFM